LEDGQDWPQLAQLLKIEFYPIDSSSLPPPPPALDPRSATVINGGKYRLHLFKTTALCEQTTLFSPPRSSSSSSPSAVLLVVVLCDSLLGHACEISSRLAYPGGINGIACIQDCPDIPRGPRKQVGYFRSALRTPCTSGPFDGVRCCCQGISYVLRKRFSALFTSTFRRTLARLVPHLYACVRACSLAFKSAVAPYKVYV